jgi:hypothetical protein
MKHLQMWTMPGSVWLQYTEKNDRWKLFVGIKIKFKNALLLSLSCKEDKSLSTIVKLFIIRILHSKVNATEMIISF